MEKNKKEETPRTEVVLNSNQIFEFSKQLFCCNCKKSKETIEKMNELIKSDGEFAIMLLNVIQSTYSQGMRHGAAMTAYGNNSSEIKYKIIEETEYDSEAFEAYWIIAKKYLMNI